MRGIVPTASAITVAAALTFVLPGAAQAADVPESPTQSSTATVNQLSADQIATINALETTGSVSAPAAASPAPSTAVASRSRSAPSYSASRRASYYQGSALMWTRDNVDFGFDWSRVTYSSGYQQSGWIFPNISRNDGIGRYVANTGNHQWRANNSFGAGIPTPWGDVKVYNLSYTTHMNVTYNGAWQASRS